MAFYITLKRIFYLRFCRHFELAFLTLTHLLCSFSAHGKGRKRLFYMRFQVTHLLVALCLQPQQLHSHVDPTHVHQYFYQLFCFLAKNKKHMFLIHFLVIKRAIIFRCDILGILF